jgi:hypothetical protein
MLHIMDNEYELYDCVHPTALACVYVTRVSLSDLLIHQLESNGYDVAPATAYARVYVTCVPLSELLFVSDTHRTRLYSLPPM